MPECPNCHTPYEEGQRYCNNCGSFLLHREKGDTFCPQCGVRVSPLQEYCHECNAPLVSSQTALEAEGAKPEAEVPQETPAAPVKPPSPVAGTPNWLLALLAGAGIVIIILLILLFTRGTSTPPVPPPAPQAEAPAPAPAPPAPAATAPAAPAPATPAPAAVTPDQLKEQLTKVLSTLREAQLNRDIIQFMSAYSFTYPELDEKRASTLNAWENYDFTNLVFTIDKVQPVDADNAIAWVTWYIDTKNRKTHELANSTQTYKVRFAKELGKWRIRSLEEVEE
jgi:type IV secretory pathway VirB10-like protein